MFFALTPILLPCFSSPKVFKNLLIAHIFPSTLPFQFLLPSSMVSWWLVPRALDWAAGVTEGSTYVLGFLLSTEQPTPPACSNSLPRNGSGVVDHTVTEAVEMAQRREHCRKRGVVTWPIITYYRPTLWKAQLQPRHIPAMRWSSLLIKATVLLESQQVWLCRYLKVELAYAPCWSSKRDPQHQEILLESCLSLFKSLEIVDQWAWTEK